jgi:MinD-like ATPase involved in chromosome partitioning or flagellar assembly
MTALSLEEKLNGHAAKNAPRAARFVAVHSFRGGTGKSNLSANLAYLAARDGARVGVIDADLQAPALRGLFGLEPKHVLRSFSEFVLGRCDLHEVPIDLTNALDLGKHGGALHLLPASADLETVTSILFDGYDVARLNECVLALAKELDLDYLIFDTHLGFNRETLLTLAICDTVIVLVRPDDQDQQGAAVLVQIAKRIGVPSVAFVPNMFGGRREAADITQRIQTEFGVPVVGVLPWCKELMDLGSRAIFAAQYPRHPFTKALEHISQQLLPVMSRNGGRS